LATPDYRVVSRRLSAERLAPYRLIAGPEPGAAISLYEWNVEVSSAWFSVICDVEVLLRNAMNEQWYLTRAGAFSPEAQLAVANARSLSTRDGRPESVGQVVTELNFGFWRFLLTSRYERSLWRTCLYRAWPGQGRRQVVHDAVYRLHGLRNRVAHHEPIHNRPLRELMRWRSRQLAGYAAIQRHG
jgi:hypothetical protein